MFTNEMCSSSTPYFVGYAIFFQRHRAFDAQIFVRTNKLWFDGNKSKYHNRSTVWRALILHYCHLPVELKFSN